VTFELRHRSATEGFSVAAESSPHSTKGSDPLWTFKLAPGETRVVRYRLEHIG